MPLTPERWRELAVLIDELLDTAPQDRAGVLAARTGDDAAFRLKVEQLLSDGDHGFPLLDRPARERFAALFGESSVTFPASLEARYPLVRELGKGGMATVFLARDLKHDRDVAIKVMRPELVLGRERFHREIAIAARLRHPHIVPLFDSGDADGTLYYVMPYEAGESLRARLVVGGPLEVADAVTVLRDIAEALACAHGHGIVHRDIKPDNVLLSGGHAMVTDFGVARAITESAEGTALVTSGIALGTPAYMAPEQITTDSGADHRADIYAFGVLAYEILSGLPPFHGNSPHRVVLAHLTEVPEPLGHRRPDVPAALEAVVMRCLKKVPAERWQHATEILRALDHWEVRTVAATPDVASASPDDGFERSPSVRPDGGETRFRKASRRRLAGLVTAMIIVIAGAAVATRIQARGRTTTPPAAAGDSRPMRPPTENVAAHELYLRASDPALLRSDSGAQVGLDLFRQAVALDSSFAAGWAGLGRMYARVANNASSRERERLFRLAEEATMRAVALDDSLAEAHASLGLMRMTSHDFRGAEQHLRRAIDLEPGRAVFHEWMVALYLWTERPAVALAQAEQAVALDPLSPSAHAELAHALLMNDRCDEALMELGRLSSLTPPLLRTAGIAAMCYARKEMWPEAIAALRPQAERGEWGSVAALGFVLGRSGQRVEAMRIRATLLDRWRHGGGAFDVAVVHAGLGETDEAIAWLERSITDGSLLGAPPNPTRTMILGPLFEDVRRHPGWTRVRERLQLSPG